MDQATKSNINGAVCRLSIRAKAHAEITREAARRIDELAEDLRTVTPRIDDIRVFGPGVSKGCGSGAGLWFGDTAEIPLLGRDPVKRFDYRLGWLATDDDLIVIGGPSCRPFEAYQRDWLQAPGITYLNVDPQSRPPRASTLAVCLRNPHAYGRLLAALDGATGVTLHAHLTTGRAWALASRLSQDLGAPIHVAGPPPILSRLINNKLWFGDVARRLLGTGATPEKRAAYSAAALTRHVAALAQAREKLVVKLPDSAGSAGNLVMATRDIRALSARQLRDRLLDDLSLAGCENRFPMLVEVWDANVLANPSVQTWIPQTAEGPPVIEGIFEQILSGDRAAFAGAAPADPPGHVKNALYRGAFRLALLFQKLGYFGRCSFDTVVTAEDGDAGKIHWIECNARWGGVSVPMSLVNRLTSDNRSLHYIIVQNETGEFAPLPFSKAMEDFADFAPPPGLDSGVLFLSPNMMEAGLGNHFLVFAKDQDSAKARAEEVMRRLQASD